MDYSVPCKCGPKGHGKHEECTDFGRQVLDATRA